MILKDQIYFLFSRIQHILCTLNLTNYIPHLLFKRDEFLVLPNRLRITHTYLAKPNSILCREHCYLLSKMNRTTLAVDVFRSISHRSVVKLLDWHSCMLLIDAHRVNEVLTGLTKSVVVAIFADEDCLFSLASLAYFLSFFWLHIFSVSFCLLPHQLV